MSKVVCGALIAVLCSAVSAAQKDPAEIRAHRVLTQLTPEERRTLLLGLQPFLMPRSERPTAMGAGYVPGVPRLGIPALIESDASLGVANFAGLLRPGDVATALPSGAAMASSWDPALIERAGAAIGSEARAKGFNVLLAGGVNLVREPRNGRNFEYLGEDPLLAGTLAGHAIRGVQSNNILSTIKHYALNAQETGRIVLSANLAEEALRESDLLAFEIGVEIGKPGAVMCSYNQVNHVYACENSFLLNDVLRRDWGYQGFVMSDWGAVHSTSIRQGLDQESGTNPKESGWFGAKLVDALKAAQVSQTDIDRSALRILRAMYADGLVDHPVTSGQPADFDAHGELAREVAENGIVLLKNERGLLPITDGTKRILLVGGHADVGVICGGGGSSQVNPVGGPALGITVATKPTYVRKLYAKSSPLQMLQAQLPNAMVTFDDGADPQRAAAAARQADLVVVFAEQFTTESKDVANLSLPDNQDSVITAVAAANEHTAVILETGGPVLMPWLNQVGAVLEAWYPGQRGGEAIARVLTGEVDAAGRLPMTFPASIEQTPNPHLPGAQIATDKTDKELNALPDNLKHFPVTYPEGADVGYRWYERTRATPLFAFGYGLSYTRFNYGGLRLEGGRTLTARFQVTNAGGRPGIATAQVYARVTGVKHLVGWSRVSLKSGETREVTVTADPRLLATFDVKGRSWHVAPGRYAVEVGSASDAAELTGEVRLASRRIRP